MCAGECDLRVAEEEALAAVRLEGQEPSEEAAALLAAIVAREETTAGEEIQQLLDRYRR
jgi:hypothetical protein